MRFNRLIMLLVPLLCWATLTAAKGEYRDLSKVISFEKLDRLEVKIELGVAELDIARAKGNNLLEADIHYRSNRGTPTIEFQKRGQVGILTIRSSDIDDDEGHNLSRLKKGEERWELRFGKQIPIHFDMELGLVSGVVDLSGLRVKNLELSGGLSDLHLVFNEPNPETLESLKLEVGLGEFSGEKLGNANFKQLTLENGLGKADLDFSGDWQIAEASVQLEIGLGSADVTVPSSIGVEVESDDNFLASVDLDRNLEKVSKGLFRSQNWSNARHKLKIRAEVGLGRLEVRVVD